MRPSPSMVIAAYVQPLVEGRKVVVFGDCTSGLAEVLVERGARLVHVYDSDLTRVAEASARGTSGEIAYAPLGQSGIAVRDGAFDVGIIENLAAADDAPALTTRLRRALAARGVAVVACPNLEVQPVLLPDAENARSGPTYYELYEIVSAEFDEVRMVGQTPFVGYALADFTPGVQEEFSLDTGFVRGGAEEAEWYLAVASHFPSVIEPFTVVQLPAAQLLDACANGKSAAPLMAAQRRIAELESELATQRKRADVSKERELLLEAKRELDKRDAWAHELEGRAGAADERADAAESRADEAEAQLERAEARAAAAETRVQLVESRLQDAEQRAKDFATKGAALAEELELERRRGKDFERRMREAQHRVQEAEGRLDAASRELRELEEKPAAVLDTRQLDALEARLARLKETLEKREQELSEQQRLAQDLEDDFDAVEVSLRERGQQIIELQRELRVTERFAAQLLVQLEGGIVSDDDESAVAAQPEPAPSASESSAETAIVELRTQLDELARLDARHAADLTAARWTISELENKLAHQRGEAEAIIERLRAELQHKLTLLEQLGQLPSNS